MVRHYFLVIVLFVPLDTLCWPVRAQSQTLSDIVVLTPTFVADSHFTQGYETCGAIKGKIESLFHEAETLCQPGYDHGKIAIVLASPLPVFRSPEGKRAWFIVIVAAVGYEARRAGLKDFSTLYVVDSESVKTLDAYAISIAQAANLQQRVKDERITMEAYVSAVMDQIRPTKMPKSLFPDE